MTKDERRLEAMKAYAESVKDVPFKYKNALNEAAAFEKNIKSNAKSTPAAKPPELIKSVVGLKPKTTTPVIDKTTKGADGLFVNPLMKEFIEWMVNKKAYSTVFAPGKEATAIRELNSYIPVLKTNIFDVNLSNTNEVFKVLLNLKSNPEFMAFSAKKGNGRPQAILGAKNYQAFLELKFK